MDEILIDKPKEVENSELLALILAEIKTLRADLKKAVAAPSK